MTSVIGMITIDTLDPAPLARWWAERLDGQIIAENDGWFVVVKLPSGQQFAFQKVDDPTPGKNRIHLDLLAPDLDAEVSALVDAGATVVEPREVEGFRWITLADPDGNQFCVAQQGEH